MLTGKTSQEGVILFIVYVKCIGLYLDTCAYRVSAIRAKFKEQIVVENICKLKRQKALSGAWDSPAAYECNKTKCGILEVKLLRLLNAYIDTRIVFEFTTETGGI